MATGDFLVLARGSPTVLAGGGHSPAAREASVNQLTANPSQATTDSLLPVDPGGRLTTGRLGGPRTRRLLGRHGAPSPGPRGAGPGPGPGWAGGFSLRLSGATRALLAPSSGLGLQCSLLRHCHHI